MLIALSLFLSSGAQAQTSPAQSQSTKNNASASSAGLLNDWLREKSDAAQAWDVGGDVRLRYEVKRDAGPFPNNDFIRRGVENDNDFPALRTRVHLGYEPAAWVQFFAEGRDARTWGDERPRDPESDDFDLYQGYVRLGNPQEFPLTLKIGRQEMRYGDDRFVGISDWTTTGRTFDAVKLRYENDSFWIDAFSSRVVVPYDNHFNVANDYDWFSGIYASTRALIPWQTTEIFFFSRNASSQAANAVAPSVPGSPSNARDVYTFGFRFASLPNKLAGWDYTTEIAGQIGSVSQGGERRSLRSLAADATAGYTFADFWARPRLDAGYTYASGDSDPTDDEYETFDPLLGTNHRPYGQMDLFGLRNIHIPNVSLGLKPMKQLSVRLMYLAFWLADDNDFLYPESGSGRNANGYGRNPSFDSFVGSELDLIVTYSPTENVECQVGYGHFFVGDYIRQSVNSVPANGGETDADWFYLQAKFEF